MLQRILAGLVAGVVFLVLDGLINANPIGQRLYAAYRPIARPSVNALAGSLIDLVYGVVLAQIFVVLWPSLPGGTALMKAMSFGLLVWFLRVVMRVAGEWIVTTVPPPAHAYTLVTGLVQLLVVAGILAAFLAPRA